MTTKLVLVGDPLIEHELVSFNTLGSHPDNSIVLTHDAIAGEHARITRRSDGWFVVRDVGGGVRVNGERVDERVLRSGDELVLGSAAFRLEVSSEPSSESRERPARAATARIEPGWTQVPTQGLGRLVALDRGRYAVAHSRPEWGGPRSRLLARDGELWRMFAEIDDDIRGVWELDDGSLLADGPRVCMHGRPGDLRAVPHGSTARIHWAWGPSSRCAYALSDGRLLHFDGDRWRRADLGARGLEGDTGKGPGSWTRGVCDPTGRCWIVGADLKHGSLATGSGTTWEWAGSAGIGGLDLACGADGTLFVLGFGMTRGLWPVGRASHRLGADASRDAPLRVVVDDRWSVYGGSWRSLDGYAASPVFPRTPRCCELDRTRVVVVGSPWPRVPTEVHVFLDDPGRS